MGGPAVTLDFSTSVPIKPDGSQQGVSLDFSTAEPLISMIGPKGESAKVTADNVSAMREKNYAVTPESGVPMLTKEGQKLYAAPSEVDQFESSGKMVQINPDGSLYLKPGQSESSQEFRDRHDTYFQAHQSAATREALATSDKIAGVESKTMAGTAAAGSLALGGRAALRTAIAAATTPVGQQVVKEGGKYLLKAAGAVGAGYLGRLGWSLGGKWVRKLVGGE